MKFNWAGLSIFFLIYYFIGDPLRELLMQGSTDVLDYSEGTKDVLLMLSSLFVFYLYCLFSYASMYLFFPQKKWLLCILGIVIGVIFPIGVRYLIQQNLFDWLFDFTNYPREVSVLRYLRDNLYFSFRFSTFGILFYLITFTFYKEKREKSLSIANQKMELTLLRSQINPHFLLNSLNNIYSLVFHQSEKSLEALNTLSDMLKYSLYETKEKVSLQEEISYVEKFLDLSKLRFDYPLAIDMNINPEVLSLKIPQFILMPLIENALKHGDLRDPASPLIIRIYLEDNLICTEVKNKKSIYLKDHTGGIGLENIKKRLELIYEQQHIFKIDEQENFFRVYMKFPGL